MCPDLIAGLGPTNTFAAGNATASTRRNRRIAAASMTIFVLAVSLRVSLLFVTRSYRSIETSEVQSVAASLATHGQFADAYGPNTGPTAHTSPLYPLVLSVLYRTFPTVKSREISQEILACCLAGLLWGLLPVVSLACDMNLDIGIWSGLAGALIPVNRWAETKGAFETTFGGVFLVLLFIFYMWSWQTRKFTLRAAVFGGVISGLAVLAYAPLLSPLLGLLIAGYFVIRSEVARQYLLFATAVFIMLAITLLPWAVRNYRVLGSFIWTRSNFPLELRLSNNDLARANFSDNEQVMNLYHPRVSRVEKAKLRKLGEIEYERQQLNEVLHWIATHKREFVLLTARRAIYFWFPAMKRPFQTTLLVLLTLLGLLGLVLLLRTGSYAGYGFLTILIMFPIVYYFVQSFPRYVYPIEWCMFYLGTCEVIVLLHKIRASYASRRAR
jgi:MFS family permease